MSMMTRNVNQLMLNLYANFVIILGVCKYFAKIYE